MLVPNKLNRKKKSSRDQKSGVYYRFRKAFRNVIRELGRSEVKSSTLVSSKLPRIIRTFGLISSRIRIQLYDGVV